MTHAALDDSFALLQIGVVDAGLGSGVGYGCGGGGDREGQGCEEVGEEHGWMWVSLGFWEDFWWSLGLEIGLRVVILDLCGTALGLLYSSGWNIVSLC